MCFVDLEKAFDSVTLGVLCGVLVKYGVTDHLAQAVRSLYDQCQSLDHLKQAVCSLYDRCQSLVCITGNKPDWFPVRVGLCQGCHLFIIFIDRIPRRSQGVKEVRSGALRIASLLFADDVVLLVSSCQALQLSLDWFTAQCEAVGMRISTSKSDCMVLCQQRVECTLQVREEILP